MQKLAPNGSKYFTDMVKQTAINIQEVSRTAIMKSTICNQKIIFDKKVNEELALSLIFLHKW